MRVKQTYQAKRITKIRDNPGVIISDTNQNLQVIKN